MSHPQNTAPSSLIGSAQNRPAEDPIFAIHGEALERTARGIDVIDASLGTLMDEDGKLSVMPTVLQAFSRVDAAKAAAYAPIAGPREFNTAVAQDVFGPSGLADQSLSVGTAGGTGAIHHAVLNFLDRGESLLTTDFYWGPYSTIADQADRGIETFRMFNEERRFDLAALEKGLAELGQRQARILLILNFPCHNPTGYSLGDAEWKEVVRILRNADKSTPITLLLDLAYFKYGAQGTDAWTQYIPELVGEIPVVAAWSASKSFAQYGSRVGGMAVAFRDEAERNRIGNALSYSCRATWSNCNHLGMLAISRLLVDEDMREGVEADRNKLLAMLGERVEIFNREAAALGLHYPRYEGGFFVTVFTKDPAETTRRCREENLFVVPIRGAVRIALCATPKAKVARRVQIMGRAVAGLQEDPA